MSILRRFLVIDTEKLFTGQQSLSLSLSLSIYSFPSLNPSPPCLENCLPVIMIISGSPAISINKREIFWESICSNLVFPLSRKGSHGLCCGLRSRLGGERSGISMAVVVVVVVVGLSRQTGCTNRCKDGSERERERALPSTICLEASLKR